MLNAEELGIASSATSTDSWSSTNPDVRRLLGSREYRAERWKPRERLGVKVVKPGRQLRRGCERNVAPVGVKTAAGINDLWTKGGLQYAPPIR